jgi:hypothetical protein
MHVSRLLRRALQDLRAELTEMENGHLNTTTTTSDGAHAEQ